MINAPIHVLMADDEEIVLDIMAKQVAHAGYQVTKARDGQEAIDSIMQNPPDVVILDITMPKLTGWEVLQRLRQHPPTKRWIPVIIVSALGEVNSIKKGMELEADHYLVKPCKLEDIIKAIRMMVTLAAGRNQ